MKTRPLISRSLFNLSILMVSALVISGCTGPKPIAGMVEDPGTGLRYGSMVSTNLVTDSSFYTNKKVKVRVRNTSGDQAFDLHGFKQQLTEYYVSNGYEAATEDDYGLLIDVNVMHSNHIQSDYTANFGFLGSAFGAIAGASSNPNSNLAPAIGSISGATLGSIIGNNITEDTYMIVAQVTFGVLKTYKSSKKKITFSRSKKLKNINDPDEDEEVLKRAFRKTYTNQIAVYAGGRNIPQSEIVSGVSKRMIRIVGEIL